MDHLRALRRSKRHPLQAWGAQSLARTIPDDSWRGPVVARSTTHDPYHERGVQGELLKFPGDGRPLFLTGTFDKPLEYDSSIYADEHHRFHESLQQADAVVVIGYGFRDKAINSQLIGWLNRAGHCRLTVIHGDEAKLLAAARPAIQRQWKAWVGADRLRVVEKWIRDTGWGDIARTLG